MFPVYIYLVNNIFITVSFDNYCEYDPGGRLALAIVRQSRLIFFVPALPLSIHILPFFRSYVSLSYFILAVPMRECLGKHSRMSSTFPIAILNGTCFFREAKWSLLRPTLHLSKTN